MPHKIASVVQYNCGLILRPQSSPDLLKVEGKGLGGSAESDRLNTNVSPGASRQVEPFTKEIDIAQD